MPLTYIVPSGINTASTFTMLSVVITGTTNALSTTTGILRVSGGVGIGQNLYVGGDIVANKIVVQLTTITTTLVETDDIIRTLNATNATSTITGALQVAGGAGIGQNLYVGGTLNLPSQTANTVFAAPNGSAGSPSFRSLVAADIPTLNQGTTGNAGSADSIKTIRTSTAGTYYLTFVDADNATPINENLYTTSSVYVSPAYGMTLTQSLTVGGSTNATSTSSGAIITNGGIGVGKDVWINGQVNIINGTESTTTGSGALIITGGVGIGKNIISRGSMFIGSGTITVGTAGEIRASNEITAYYGSDINLKENIKLIGDPIEKLNQISGYEFDWKDSYLAERGGVDGYYVRKHDIGVIAQEIEKILPDIVGIRADGYKAVKYEKIIPLLIEAIKNQQNTINHILDLLKKHDIK